MSLFIKNTTWKSGIPWVKVAGVWKRCFQWVKVSGTWKMIYGIPSGLIVMSADGSVPSGWTRFSAADGKFIVGAGSSYSYGSTGGSSTVSVSTTTDTGSDGSHVSHAASNQVTEQNTSNQTGTGDATGAHTHTSSSCTSYTPKAQNMVLIKANGDKAFFPANAMFFAMDDISDFSNFSATNFLRCASSNSSIAAVSNAVTSSDGSHHHPGVTRIMGGWSELPEQTRHYYSGAHTHTMSVTATDSFKHATLRALYKASEFGASSGMIGMWEGTTAPTGWALCNGSGGTLDLRDYFILFSVTGTGTKTGTNQVSLSFTVDTVSWTHDHYDDDYQTSEGLSFWVYNVEKSVSHTHTGTMESGSITYTPVYYALTFIQKQ